MKVTTLKYKMVNGHPIFTAEPVKEVPISNIKGFKESITALLPNHFIPGFFKYTIFIGCSPLAMGSFFTRL
jgi:hypothetical protein